VTHDQEEALEVADRVAIFHEGRVEQVGTPEEVYERSATPFVCGFLGQVNLLHGRVQGGRVRIGAAEVEVPTSVSFDGAPVVAYARPHEIEVTLEGGDGAHLAGVVRRVLSVGPVVRLEVDRPDGGEPIAVELGRDACEALSTREATVCFCASAACGSSPTTGRRTAWVQGVGREKMGMHRQGFRPGESCVGPPGLPGALRGLRRRTTRGTRPTDPYGAPGLSEYGVEDRPDAAYPAKATGETRSDPIRTRLLASS